jgi:hypothetical protein
MTDPFKTYIQSLQADLARGNASDYLALIEQLILLELPELKLVA